MSSKENVGAKMGPRVAKLAADAVLYAKQKTAPTTRKVALGVLNDFSDLIGREIRVNSGDLLTRIADHPDSPAWVKRMFGFISRGHGQGAAALGLGIMSGGMQSAVGDLISNELNPAVRPLIAANPNGVLTAGQAASAVGRGHWTYASGNFEARKNGLPNDRFDALLFLAQGPPGLGELLQALDRGSMTEDQVRTALEDAGIRGTYHDAVLSLARQLVPAAELALGVVRGEKTEDDARGEAAKLGLEGQDFDFLVRITGEAPAVQELLFLYRRGKITKDRLERGIRQSRLRNEWIPEIEELRFAPMSASDAIQAAVQSHLSVDEAKRIALENGLLAEHFEPLYETAGNPPGPGEIASMMFRDIFTHDEAVQALRESRLKNKYIEPYLKSQKYVSPPRTTVAMYHRGAIDHQRALELLHDYGVDGQLAGELIAEAQATKQEDTIKLAKTEILTLYEDQALDAQQATAMLKTLGRSDEEAKFELAIADFRRVRHATEAALNRFHSLYIAHRLNINEANGELDALGIPHKQRDALIKLWTLEREANTPTLTVGQISSAIKRGLLTPEGGFTRLQEKGYSDEDAETIVNLAIPQGR